MKKQYTHKIVQILQQAIILIQVPYKISAGQADSHLVSVGMFMAIEEVVCYSDYPLIQKIIIIAIYCYNRIALCFWMRSDVGYSQCTCRPSTWFVPNVLQGCIYTSELQRTIHWPHLLFTNVPIFTCKNVWDIDSNLDDWFQGPTCILKSILSYPGGSHSREWFLSQNNVNIYQELTS